MSVMWLVPQQVFHGLSEDLNIIGQMEFYYSEFPKSMSRVATSLYLLGAGIESLLSSLVLRSVNAITKQDGKESWVSTNINKDRTVVKGQNANNAGEEDAPTS
ncbi:hypothetical protein Tco_1439218 [Tanacetum coccineum]